MKRHNLERPQTSTHALSDVLWDASCVDDVVGGLGIDDGRSADVGHRRRVPDRSKRIYNLLVCHSVVCPREALCLLQKFVKGGT